MEVNEEVKKEELIVVNMYQETDNKNSSVGEPQVVTKTRFDYFKEIILDALSLMGIPRSLGDYSIPIILALNSVRLNRRINLMLTSDTREQLIAYVNRLKIFLPDNTCHILTATAKEIFQAPNSFNEKMIICFNAGNLPKKIVDQLKQMEATLGNVGLIFVCGKEPPNNLKEFSWARLHMESSELGMFVNHSGVQDTQDLVLQIYQAHLMVSQMHERPISSVYDEEIKAVIKHPNQYQVMMNLIHIVAIINNLNDTDLNNYLLNTYESQQIIADLKAVGINIPVGDYAPASSSINVSREDYLSAKDIFERFIFPGMLTLRQRIIFNTIMEFIQERNDRRMLENIKLEETIEILRLRGQENSWIKISWLKSRLQKKNINLSDEDLIDELNVLEKNNYLISEYIQAERTRRYTINRQYTTEQLSLPVDLGQDKLAASPQVSALLKSSLN